MKTGAPSRPKWTTYVSQSVILLTLAYILLQGSSSNWVFYAPSTSTVRSGRVVARKRDGIPLWNEINLISLKTGISCHLWRKKNLLLFPLYNLCYKGQNRERERESVLTSLLASVDVKIY